MSRSLLVAAIGDAMTAAPARASSAATKETRWMLVSCVSDEKGIAEVTIQQRKA
jgi:hypothetical protein